MRCFQAVFPDLSPGDVIRATMNRVNGWDSVATVNLTAVVEEEFNITFEAQEIEKLTSFQAFLNRIGSR